MTKRELHIEKALEVTDTSKVVKPNADDVIIDEHTRQVAKCKYFTVCEITSDEEYSFDVDDNSFVSLTVVEGSGAVMANGSCISVDLGDTVFLPAGIGETKIYGNLKAIKASV